LQLVAIQVFHAQQSVVQQALHDTARAQDSLALCHANHVQQPRIVRVERHNRDLLPQDCCEYGHGRDKTFVRNHNAALCRQLPGDVRHGGLQLAVRQGRALVTGRSIKVKPRERNRRHLGTVLTGKTAPMRRLLLAALTLVVLPLLAYFSRDGNVKSGPKPLPRRTWSGSLIEEVEKRAHAW
jgi:hypothetical protein